MSGLQGSVDQHSLSKPQQTCSRQRSIRIALVACDVYRPAAIDQLKVVGEQVGVAVYSEPRTRM